MLASQVMYVLMNNENLETMVSTLIHSSFKYTLILPKHNMEIYEVVINPSSSIRLKPSIENFENGSKYADDVGSIYALNNIV